ncbi:hypothetical protein VOLCADRAFT_86681 [Volvox carteri f. nagariensis]|uniref:Uncharacterized protein n=1 Tax=Volvox carteri f. nagariensis TaxID=3068 RepID=D8TJB4_VOLCA|nr:uncharacterized protein VOLCADRAFT_86681 [Volvox carteri f. nagariensis]EFJ52343.1 hypothetical protein VOLCADRAFT_86681 [Volvox carteri f. nagariensis]|eukprot:XP_002946416.1 hypothetical protein VOLCADRAFT_86681 [Volvox carteri f. nagariensis]
MDAQHVEFETAVLVPSQREIDLETITLAVAAFPNKVGNLLMKALGAVAPLTELKHLKRVRKAPDDGTLLEAILCVLIDDGASEPAPASSTPDSTPADGPSGDSTDARRLPIPLQTLYNQYGGIRLRLLPAAAAPPQNRQQWAAWTQLWPITWRIPENGTPVTEEAPVDACMQRYFEHLMRAALQLASGSGVDNAAIIVDPAVQVPVAEAADNSAVHPLQHAVMAAVQAASERDLAQWPAERASVDPYDRNGGGDGGDLSDVMAGRSVAGVEGGTDLQSASSPGQGVLPHGRDRVIYCQPDAVFGALGGCRRLHACCSEIVNLGQGSGKASASLLTFRRSQSLD